MEKEGPGAAGRSHAWFQVPWPCAFPQDSRLDGHREANLWITLVATGFSKCGPRGWATDLRGLHRVS